MDNTRGQFEPISVQKFEEQIKKPEPLVFKAGEILEIRGSRFRIEKILRNKLILKLLPKIKS
jgi:uncharacterized Zn finger protein